MITAQDSFRYSALSGPPCSEMGARSEHDRLAFVRNGRILVIDDEPAICASLRRVFSRQHFVTTTTDAMSALELFNAGERFDIVLCDLMMPGMSGLDLYTEVARTAPDDASRFLFMSGASLSPHVAAFLANIPNKLLTKPFDMRVLTKLVQEKLK